MNSPPNKRRRTAVSKKETHATNNINIHATESQADKKLTLDALEIVSSHLLVDIKTKNINLQKLIHELNDISIEHIVTPHEEEEVERSLQKFKEGKRVNAMPQGGLNVEDNSWCIERNEYIYDPHPRGKASQYNWTDAVYPALKGVQRTGDEALLIALGHFDSFKELKLLQVKNHFFGTKLQNMMSRLELNVMMINHVGPGVDYFERERIRRSNNNHLLLGVPSSEEKAAISDRFEQGLSELSSDNLVDYIKVSNLDLREGIARLARTCGMDELSGYADIDCFSGDYGLMLIKEFEELLWERSLKFLPRTRNIAFDPMLEAENHWLSEKLDGLILMLKLALLDEAIEIDNNNDDDDSLADFVADEDEEDDEFWEEFYREQQEDLAFAMEQRGR